VQYRLPSDRGYVGGALSSASKLPSFYALGHPLVGNTALRPEHSRQREIYYASSEDTAWKTRATLFAARYRDLVDFDPGPPPRLVNRTRIESNGLELSVRRTWSPRLSGALQTTVMDLRDLDNGPPLRLRPKRQASAMLDSQMPLGWRMQAAVVYVGSRHDSSIPTGEMRLGGYAELDLAFQKSGKNWTAVVAVDNVLDRKAEEIVGTAIGARRLRVGMRWRGE
jgi:vitamin B12 transporter